MVCAVTMSVPTVERRTHERWGECVWVSNGTIELLAPTTIGPRIVRFGFLDGRNEFHLFPEDYESVPRFGGHRLWHAPEAYPRTYDPEDEPVDAELLEDGVRLVGPTGDADIQKAMTVRMSESAARVEVEHELTNRNPWPIEFAPWAISVLAPGGTAVLPLAQQADDEALLPDRSVQLWPYTSPADDRIEFEDDAVFVDQANDREPTKIGTSGADGWVAYVNDGHAFRKDYHHDPEATYPDRGSAAEAYTDDTLLELETLAPLQSVAPEQTVRYTEAWTLADGIDRPADAAQIDTESR